MFQSLMPTKVSPTQSPALADALNIETFRTGNKGRITYRWVGPTEDFTITEKAPKDTFKTVLRHYEHPSRHSQPGVGAYTP